MWLLTIFSLTLSLRFTHLPAFTTYTHQKIHLTCLTDDKTARIIWFINGTKELKGPTIILWDLHIGVVQCMAATTHKVIYSPVINLVLPQSIDKYDVLVKTTIGGYFLRYSKLPTKYFQPNQIVCTGDIRIIDDEYAYGHNHQNYIRCYHKTSNVTTALYTMVLFLMSDLRMLYPPENYVVVLNDLKEGICISSNTKINQFKYKKSNQIVDLEDIKNGEYSCEDTYGEVRHFTLRLRENIKIANSFDDVTEVTQCQRIFQFKCDFEDTEAEIRWFFDEERNEIKNFRDKKIIVLNYEDIFKPGETQKLLSCFVINQYSMDHKETLIIKKEDERSASELSTYMGNGPFRLPLIIVVTLLLLVVGLLVFLLYMSNRKLQKLSKEFQFGQMYVSKN